MARDVIDGVGLSEQQKLLRQPQRTLSFLCKCGCDMFHVDVEMYADYSWMPVIVCAACKQINTITEPMTNGPH